MNKNIRMEDKSRMGWKFGYVRFTGNTDEKFLSPFKWHLFGFNHAFQQIPLFKGAQGDFFVPIPSMHLRF